MFGFFINDSPGQQLLTGAVLLLAGLLIFPAIFSGILPIVKWMNGWWSDTPAWQAGFGILKSFVAFVCSFFAVVGALKLAAYSVIKFGLVSNPWT